ncbi:outer membrane transport energization protein ExbB [Novosphingobium sp. CF614]|uniref:tonB-system energizer ExbB n=1 Tax=Novosphingobium sp. CF614 TaxID=1884364 RepID=UPI0008F06934|nr:tonB-system energizer ExbB [Novosphingobium sp. CF614]SFF92309.1 outer membrane transport energization protein ExbB [Novosphingobium sp. CF614]
MHPSVPVDEITAATGGPPTIPIHLTPWRMFADADPIVQAVMIVLLMASIACWAVLIAKSSELSAAKRALNGDLRRLGAAGSIGELHDMVHGPVSAMVEAARVELDRPASIEGVKERLSLRLNRIEVHAARRMLKGTTLLATIASVGPFVGLLGTVWGIMNAFIGIAQTQTTSLAVVAPGIAEALLATACGLLAAIPAVVIFNAFIRAVAEYQGRMGDASTEIAVLTSRVLDPGLN